MNVVLFEPQIPPNTGNVARLCAATSIPLHLVGPLGFQITDRHLRRAGLDYWESVDLRMHDSLHRLLEDLPRETLHFFSKRASTPYTAARFRPGDFLIFGNETQGLPDWIFEHFPDRFLLIPIFNPRVRSLNLSSAVAIAVYEALRQNGLLSV